MTEGKRRKYLPKVETRLRREDFHKVEMLANLEEKTRSEIVREAVLFFLDHKEGKQNATKENRIVQAINAGVERICALLARQGRQLGVIFELTVQSMGSTKDGRVVLEDAIKRTDQKMGRPVSQEERDLLDLLKKARTE